MDDHVTPSTALSLSELPNVEMDGLPSTLIVRPTVCTPRIPLVKPIWMIPNSI